MKGERSSADKSGWRIVSACVAGASHVRAGLPCQDSAAYSVCGNTLIAAVADGAGSAARSEVGSKLAAETSVRTAKAILAERHDHSPRPIHETCLSIVLRESFEAARRRLYEEACALNIPARDLATTLILAVHTRDLLAVAQIGDGAAVASSGDGSYRTRSAPQRGEYANQTTFVVSRNAADSLQIRIEPVGESANRLAMFTDGIQNLALNGRDDSPHAPFFDPVFEWMQAQTDTESANAGLESFLKSPRVVQRADDDLTLLLASRAG